MRDARPRPPIDAFPDLDSIDEPPSTFLARVGDVFAEFGFPRQDSGNVAYGVRLDSSTRLFVKTPGDPDDTRPYLSHAERVDLLRNAVRVAESCQHPALPRLWWAIESPIGPMLVYDWVEGELLGVPRSARQDPTSSFQRFRALPPETILGCLDTVYEVHRDVVRQGWIAVDFYDGCLIYDFEASRLRIVDLDMYRQGPFQNSMGRMFGSSRFMAPEEFERGATIDQVTNVFVMGRTAEVFLGDSTDDGLRAPEAVRAVVQRAVDPDRSQRFGSMEAFHAAWVSARSA